MAGGSLSIKRRLAARVAEATGLPREKVEVVLRGFYEETLRSAHESGGFQLPGAGTLRRKACCRGSRCPRTGRDLGAHWAFWFRPARALVKRTAEICASRRGQA